MIRRLQKRFVAIAMLSLFVVLALIIGIINVLNYRTMVKDADDTIFMLARNGHISMPSPDDRVEDRFAQHPGRRDRMLSPELPFQARYFIGSVNRTDGTIDSINLKNIISVDETSATALIGRVLNQARDQGFIQSFRYAKISNGDLDLLVFLNCERELATFHRFLLVSLVIATIGFSLVFLLISLLSSKIVRPIAQTYEKQKRFITDAGHELKTPITIIGADTDLLESEIGGNEWLLDVRSQTKRLTELTNDLIYLSKMEEVGTRLQKSCFSLSSTVAEMAVEFHAAFKAKQKELRTEVLPNIYLTGEEKSIQRLFSILLDNAVKYASPNSTVLLSLKKNGRQSIISVKNEISEEERGDEEQLFERFYRADASRSFESGGFGLGLSIAKAIVEAHKGKIRAFYEGEKDSVLTIEAVFFD